MSRYLIWHGIDGVEAILLVPESIDERVTIAELAGEKLDNDLETFLHRYNSMCLRVRFNGHRKIEMLNLVVDMTETELRSLDDDQMSRLIEYANSRH